MPTRGTSVKTGAAEWRIQSLHCSPFPRRQAFRTCRRRACSSLHGFRNVRFDTSAIFLASCGEDEPADDDEAVAAADDEVDDDVDEPDPVDDDEMVTNLVVAEEPPDLEPHNLTAAAAGLIGFVTMPGLVWLDYDLDLSPMVAEDRTTFVSSGRKDCRSG